MKKYILGITMVCVLILGCFWLSRRAAVASSESAQNKKTVLIDAGHGGADPGMIGVGGLEEKGINLAVAKKIKEKLEKSGFTVLMTREKDMGLYEETVPNKKAQDMQKRIAMIREKQPILSISIHQNSYQDPAVYGPQVFYYEDSLEGRKLAEVLQEKLNEELEIGHPRVAKGNKSYYLLKRSPGVLAIVECGFLTNTDEAEKLQTGEYQDRVAEAVTAGVRIYLESQS